MFLVAASAAKRHTNSPMTAIGVMVVVTAVTDVTVAGPTFIITINAGLLQLTYNRTTRKARGEVPIYNLTHDRP